jgi:hypothetical protein
LLTRRVKAKSARRAVVVRFSQEPAPLRTTRSAGRAASLDGSATRARSLQTAGRGWALRSARSSHG